MWACFVAEPAQHLAATHRASWDPWPGEVPGCGKRALNRAVGRQHVGVDGATDRMRLQAEQVGRVQAEHAGGTSTIGKPVLLFWHNGHPDFHPF